MEGGGSQGGFCNEDFFFFLQGVRKRENVVIRSIIFAKFSYWWEAIEVEDWGRVGMAKRRRQKQAKEGNKG